MCSFSGALQIAGLAFQTVGAINQAQAQRQAYEYQAQVARNNATLAQYQAKDAIEAGAHEEQGRRLKTAAMFSDQRASLAANGIDLGEGTATDLLATTKYIGEIDALTVRDNAAKRAWGYRVQGQDFTDQAAMKDATAGGINPMMAGVTSLLGSAGGVADSWYRNKKAGGTTDQWMWGTS